MRSVFLDHQSSTPVLPEVFAAMQPYFTAQFGNPASLHGYGLRARAALERARVQIAALINAESPEEIIFTSSGTESANLAVKGVAYASQRFGNHLVTSAIEHPAVARSLDYLEQQGFACTRVKVNGEGELDPAAIRAALTDKTMLICAHQANHDIGTLQPIEAIGRFAAERGIPFFVDASLSGGWLPIDVRAMGIQLLSLAPHRFYGPQGVGILYRSRRTRLHPILHGGVQEEGRRPGTPNVPGIVGAGLAAEIAERELTARQQHTGRLQARLWSGLRERIEHLKLMGPPPGEKRLVTNLNVAVEFVEGEAVMLRSDLKGIAFTSGTACATKALKLSPVLEALGVERSLAQGSIILSPGQENTDAEIDYVLDTLPAVVRDLRSLSPAWDDFQRGRIQSVL